MMHLWYVACWRYWRCRGDTLYATLYGGGDAGCVLCMVEAMRCVLLCIVEAMRVVCCSVWWSRCVVCCSVWWRRVCCSVRWRRCVVCYSVCWRLWRVYSVARGAGGAEATQCVLLCMLEAVDGGLTFHCGSFPLG